MLLEMPQKIKEGRDGSACFAHAYLYVAAKEIAYSELYESSARVSCSSSHMFDE